MDDRLVADRRRRAFLMQASGALLTGSLSSLATPSAPATHTVTIENVQFTPKELSVRAGDRVTWLNKDLFPHTATTVAKASKVSDPSGAFDSRSIEPNASWTFVARKPGAYPYVCTFHPTMAATLTVLP